MARFGSVGTQYFDNSGNPLVNGKLSFFESGTSTLKTTYADVNQTIANTNPVLLDGAGRQPDIFFSGAAKVVLYTADDVQIDAADPIPVGNPTDAFGSWNSLATYSQGNLVTGSDGKYYKSIGFDNTGNNPVNTSGFWQQVKFIGVWDTAATYDLYDIVEASDGFLYRSLVASNQGNDPTSTPASWGITSFSDESISFTPKIADGTTDATQDLQVGRYKKTGTTYKCWIRCSISNKGSLAGTGVRIADLPAAAKVVAGLDRPAAIGRIEGINIGPVSLEAYIPSGNNYITLRKSTLSTGNTPLQFSDVNNDFDISLFVEYEGE